MRVPPIIIVFSRLICLSLLIGLSSAQTPFNVSDQHTATEWIQYFNHSYIESVATRNVSGEFYYLSNLEYQSIHLARTDQNYFDEAVKYSTMIDLICRNETLTNSTNLTNPCIGHKIAEFDNAALYFIDVKNFSRARQYINIMKNLRDNSQKDDPPDYIIFDQYYTIENIEYYDSLNSINDTKYFLNHYFNITNSTDIYANRANEIRSNLPRKEQEYELFLHPSYFNLTEVWNVYEYNKTHYLVNVSLVFTNNYPVAIQYPVAYYALYNFEKISYYADTENKQNFTGNIQLTHMFMVDKTLNEEEIKQLSAQQQMGGAPILLEQNLPQERLYQIPTIGLKVGPSEKETLNIAFKVKKNEFMTRFATRLSYLSNTSIMKYEKTIHLFVDDFLAAQASPESRLGIDSYDYSWSGTLSVNSPSDLGAGVLGIPDPYIYNNHTIGFVFGVVQPETKINEFNEKVSIGTDSLRIDRFESRTINTDKDTYIATTLYYPDTETNNIHWYLEPRTGREDKTPKLISGDFLNKEFSIDYEVPYYTAETNGERSLFYRVPSSTNTSDFGYSYTINRSKLISKIRAYTYSLNYTVVYLPGQFGKNKYNYNFVFDDSFVVVNSSELPQCAKLNLSTSVNYNCEFSKFKPIDQVQIVFENVNEKQEYIALNSLILCVLTFFVLAVLSHVLLLGYFKLDYNEYVTLLITLIFALPDYLFLRNYWSIPLMILVYALSVISLLWYRRPKKRKKSS